MKKIIKVIVKPFARKQGINHREDEIIISLKSPAHNGKANLELLKLLKDYFKKRYSVKDIKIIRGLKNKNKLIEVQW